MNPIGQRMRELRENVHLSQAEIAKLCGSNQSTIGKTEQGLTAPSIKLLVWWADYFDVSLDYLCCRTDQPQGKLYECKPKAHINGDEMKKFLDMCFDPQSPYNDKLKEALLNMMEESTK
jgi:transcriptional regulator with XRE-family HTH domain